MNNYQLNTNWCFWYHSINDTNWDNNSYKNLYTIQNLYDLKLINDTIETYHLQNSMFFIMRENIFPLWEDDRNKNGGCWSFKIDKRKIYNTWIELSIALLIPSNTAISCNRTVLSAERILSLE